jgi:uncharacterized membrane protein YfcA
MTFADVLILLAAGLTAGTVNAMAGGGTFFTFSGLLATGLPPINANATSAAVLTPSNIASVAAYLPEVRRHARRYLALGVASAAGGLLGALLLLVTPSATFRSLVPWFLGFATILFALGPTLTKAINGFASTPGSPRRRAAGVVMQFVVSIYGGYFGAGMGIIMLAALSLAEGDDYHFINAAKNLCATMIQGFALVPLVLAGLISWWPHFVIATLGAAVGGYFGVALARRIPLRYIRFGVVLAGAFLTLQFVLRS